MIYLSALKSVGLDTKVRYISFVVFAILEKKHCFAWEQIKSLISVYNVYCSLTNASPLSYLANHYQHGNVKFPGSS